MATSPEIHRSLPRSDYADFAIALASGLILAICAIFFISVLFSGSMAGSRDFVSYWATGQQLRHHADPYNWEQMMSIERAANLDAKGVLFMRNAPWALPTRITHTAQGIVRTGESINRVVNGQLFHYPGAVMTKDGGLEFKGWIRIPAPSSGRPLGIPDPRTLLSVLSPSAGFATDGTGTVNGVAVSHLIATTPGAVAIAPLNDVIDSEPDGARISAIDLWVDSADVVLKAEVTLTGTNGSGVSQSVTVTVTFSQIGQLQPITPPASYKG